MNRMKNRIFWRLKGQSRTAALAVKPEMKKACDFSQAFLEWRIGDLNP